MTGAFAMGPDHDARGRVRDRYGSAVARKATPAFVALHGGVRLRAEMEMVAPPGRLATVLEFGGPAGGPESANADMQQSVAWAEAIAAIARVTGDARDPASLLRARALLRQVLVIDAKAKFSQACGAVLDELGRATGGPLGPLAEGVTETTVQTKLVETCWLNYSARTAASPSAVAAVADAPEVSAIDVPRRLDSELTVSPVTIGAPAFRSGHDLRGTGVIVAVIDSEVAPKHPALDGRVTHKSNFTKEPWGFPGRHGTAVAAIVAADGQITGVAPGATVWNYKVLATNPNLNADDFGGARALQQALEDGAHIANCSWGAGAATDGSSREARACDTAWSLGLVIVKSAGNRGPGESTLTTPADAQGIIVVGGTDRQGTQVGDYSSRGPTIDGRERPHIVAPGGLVIDGMISAEVSGGFGNVGHGTSYAAPHVSGILALLLQQDPLRSPDILRQILVGFAQPLGGFGGNDQGGGLVILP